MDINIIINILWLADQRGILCQSLCNMIRNLTREHYIHKVTNYRVTNNELINRDAENNFTLFSINTHHKDKLYSIMPITILKSTETHYNRYVIDIDTKTDIRSTITIYRDGYDSTRNKYSINMIDANSIHFILLKRHTKLNIIEAKELALNRTILFIDNIIYHQPLSVSLMYLYINIRYRNNDISLIDLLEKFKFDITEGETKLLFILTKILRYGTPITFDRLIIEDVIIIINKFRSMIIEYLKEK